MRSWDGNGKPNQTVLVQAYATPPDEPAIVEKGQNALKPSKDDLARKGVILKYEKDPKPSELPLHHTVTEKQIVFSRTDLKSLVFLM